jgi:two-component system NtrC family sensor kinase
VNNAVDAILEGSTEGDLWVRTAMEGERLVIEFTDSGPGVKDPSRVFDPFYTTKPVGKGTGLGLSICYGIITEHGGTIQVRNAPTRGACFIIELPCQPVTASGASPDAPKADSGRSAHILLLDHDESVLEAVSTFLRGRDHRVRSARNMQDAHTALEQESFDVVIADLQIAEGPNGSGLESWLAQNKPALSRKLIWMCAVAPSEGAAERVGDNNSRILQKPFKVSELLTAVDELLLDRMGAAPIGR